MERERSLSSSVSEICDVPNNDLEGSSLLNNTSTNTLIVDSNIDTPK